MKGPLIPAKWISQAKKEASLSGEGKQAVANLASFLEASKEDLKNNFHPLMQTYLLTALSLDKVDGLSALKKLQLLSSVLSEKSECFGFLQALCSRKEVKALNDLPLINPEKELRAAFNDALTSDTFISLSDVDNLVDKYSKTFIKTRVPTALETYMTGIRALGEESMRKTLERFTKSVLQDTFKNERYNTEINPHLKKIQESDAGVFESWKNLTFEAPVALNALEETSFSPENFFREKLNTGHGDKEGKALLPELNTFLAANSEERLLILNKIKEKIENGPSLIRLETDKNKRIEISQALKMDQVQKLCMDFINTPISSETAREQIKKIESINSQLSTLKLGLILSDDLKELASNLKTPPKTSSEKVQLCSDWEDLFLAGSEVSGSCQRVDGEHSLNKCLLAYCLDGKNAMVAVKDEGGKILARSMLRLLWNETNSKPVIFLDRLYPDPCSKERTDEIEKAAAQCAKKVGLELFTQAKDGFLSTGEVIKSLGSSCPYEYADGANPGVTNGVFTIQGAQKI